MTSNMLMLSESVTYTVKIILGEIPCKGSHRLLVDLGNRLYFLCNGLIEHSSGNCFTLLVFVFICCLWSCASWLGIVAGLQHSVVGSISLSAQVVGYRAVRDT